MKRSLLKVFLIITYSFNVVSSDQNVRSMGYWNALKYDVKNVVRLVLEKFYDIRCTVFRRCSFAQQNKSNLQSEEPISSDQCQLFQGLVKRSDAFMKTFPTKDNRIKIVAGNDIQKQERIVWQAQNSYVVMHSRVLMLMDAFLDHKKKQGSSIEKNVYQSMSRESFIERLMSKRPLMFMTASDAYLLKDGTKGHGGFESIGTEQEQSPLTLQHYLSYDEMQIAALLDVSVSTYFINNGNRNNAGVKSISDDYEHEGVYVGLVGARFEKPERMEWQHIVVTPQRNADLANKQALLSLWEKFYQQSFDTYEQAAHDTSGKYIPMKYAGHMCYFDTIMYKKRMSMVIEPFLKDAQKRGIQANKKVYVHAVGLGLGVWQILPQQAQLLIDVYVELINKLGSSALSQIADIDFSWFPARLIVKGLKNNVIKIHFSKRNPADKLEHENSGKLLVAQYAWDGNAYPGNEYWAGMLSASGDPAAACCSTIAELQNPEINVYLLAVKK